MDIKLNINERKQLAIEFLQLQSELHDLLNEARDEFAKLVVVNISEELQGGDWNE